MNNIKITNRFLVKKHFYQHGRNVDKAGYCDSTGNFTDDKQFKCF